MALAIIRDFSCIVGNKTSLLPMEKIQAGLLRSALGSSNGRVAAEVRTRRDHEGAVRTDGTRLGVSPLLK